MREKINSLLHAKHRFIYRIDGHNVVEFSDREDGQQKVGVLSDDYHLFGFRNSWHTGYENDFPHLISRLDVYGRMTKLNGDNQGNIGLILQRSTQAGRESSELLNSAEIVAEVRMILLEAVDFLESIEIGVSKIVQREINALKQIPQVVKFIEQAQGLRNSPHGALICSLLKVADAIVEINNNPGLQDLVEKTETFAQDLLAASGNRAVDDLEVGASKKGFIQISSESSAFRAKHFYFSAKDRPRIINKLLRKVDVDAEAILQDGCRAKIIIFDGDDHAVASRKDRAGDWLKGIPDYNFEIKGSTVNAARDPKRKDVTYLGKKNNTPFEVQIVTSRENFHNEHGVRNHEIYEWIQNFQVVCRLYGSMSRARFTRKLKELASSKFTDEDGNQYSVSLEEVEKMFAAHFYLNRETDRYHWFEYDCRTNGTGVFSEEYQARRNKGTIEWIMLKAPEVNEDLKRVSLAEWEEIITTNTFPLAWEGLHEIPFVAMNFLSSIKGIPKLMTRSLLIHYRAMGQPFLEMTFADWKTILAEQELPERVSIPQVKAIIDLLSEKDGEKTFRYLLNILRTKLKVMSETEV